MNDMHASSFLTDPAGWLVVGAGVLVTTWTIVFATHAFLAPGETAPDHPKMLVLKDDR